MNQRFFSLDVFRGATVALMILVNNPGSWAHIYPPLAHAPWHGCTPTDLVFPFFLFAVGNAMAFVMPRLEAAGAAAFWKKVIQRTLLIFLIGILLHWSPFVKWSNNELVFKTFENLRIMGVLQRIALCYFFAAVLIYYFKLRGSFVAAGVLLLSYWLVCIWLGAPGDPFSLQGWFGTSIDQWLLGTAHMYKGEGTAFDPEGIASTAPAIAQVILGYLVGHYILQKGSQSNPNGQSQLYELLTGLFIAGTALTLTGYLWDMSFPINKKIWTSSYTAYTSGLAIITIAVMIYFIEIRKAKGWLSAFFNVFGKNPLFIFVLSGVLPRTLGLIRIPNDMNAEGLPKYLSPFGWYYEKVCKLIPGIPENGSLFYALSMIIFYWSICYWMDKKKIYVKV